MRVRPSGNGAAQEEFPTRQNFVDMFKEFPRDQIEILLGESCHTSSAPTIFSVCISATTVRLFVFSLRNETLNLSHTPHGEEFLLHTSSRCCCSWEGQFRRMSCWCIKVCMDLCKDYCVRTLQIRVRPTQESELDRLRIGVRPTQNPRISGIRGRKTLYLNYV